MNRSPLNPLHPQPGTVYLVGAGPGDPGLITVRGRELLEAAEVVIYDRLLRPGILAYIGPTAARHDVGKAPGHKGFDQPTINTLLIENAKAGRSVVRLKGGDPCIFGRGGEEAAALTEAGVSFEFVPGVTAGVGAAAYAGIPLTYRDKATSAVFVTGRTRGKDSVDWDAAARCDTVVCYMGMSRLADIAGKIAAVKGASVPAAVVHWGSTSGQRTLAAPLGEIAHAADAADMRHPAVLIAGEVVGLPKSLSWFEKRPLLGLRIVVTRPQDQASPLVVRLSDLGAEAICAPTIEIRPPEDAGPLRAAVRSAGDYDAVLFTSANAVRAFWDAMEELETDARALGPARVAAVGPATAAALAGRGIRADIIAETRSGAGLLTALQDTGPLEGKRYLLPRASAASAELPDGLRAVGAIAVEVSAYETVTHPGEFPALDTVDYVTFASGSAVRAFVELVGKDLASLAARWVSIGPKTSRAIEKLGFTAHVEAADQDAASMVEAIMADVAKIANAGE